MATPLSGGCSHSFFEKIMLGRKKIKAILHEISTEIQHFKKSKQKKSLLFLSVNFL